MPETAKHTIGARNMSHKIKLPGNDNNILRWLSRQERRRNVASASSRRRKRSEQRRLSG